MINIRQIASSLNQNVSRAFGFEQSQAKSLLLKELFAKDSDVPKPVRILSGHSSGNACVVSDYTSLYRSIQDLSVGAWEQFPNFPLSFLKDFAASKDISLGYHAFGLTASFNVVMGIAQWIEGLGSCAFAKATGDREGLLQGRVSCIQAASLFGAGVSFAVFRPLSMLQIIKEGSATSMIGRLGSISVQAGMVFYSIFFTALTALLGLQVHENISFLKGLDQVKNLPSQIEWLQKMARVDSKDVYEQLIAKHGKEKMQDLLVKEALTMGKSQLNALMKEASIPKIEEARLEEIVRDLVLKEGSWWSRGSMQKQAVDKLALIGLSMRVQKTQLGQTAKMQRILGDTGFGAFEKVASLKGRVSKTDAHAQKLVDQIRSAARSGALENGVVGSVSAMGIVAMITSIAFTAGLALVLASAFSLGFGFLMSAVDVYYLYKSYQSERPAPFDKKMVVFSTIVGVISLIALAGLGATGVVSIGLFPVIVAGILSALWIGQSGLTYCIMDRNEKRYELENPTLESFLKALNRNQKNVMKIFQNLPKELQRQIQVALSSHQNDMKQAALSVANQVETVKQRRLESVREVLCPYLVRESTS